MSFLLNMLVIYRFSAKGILRSQQDFYHRSGCSGFPFPVGIISKGIALPQTDCELWTKHRTAPAAARVNTGRQVTGRVREGGKAG